MGFVIWFKKKQKNDELDINLNNFKPRIIKQLNTCPF